MLDHPIFFARLSSALFLFLLYDKMLPLLGCVALVAQYHRHHSSVRACVGASGCPVHCGKTADRTQMPFAIVGRTGPGMRQIVGFWDRSTGTGTFEGEFGARHCNQNGDSTAYVCDSSAMRPSSQITLGKLVNYIKQFVKPVRLMRVQ